MERCGRGEGERFQQRVEIQYLQPLLGSFIVSKRLYIPIRSTPIALE